MAALWVAEREAKMAAKKVSKWVEKKADEKAVMSEVTKVELTVD